ncbi:MAG: glycosyl transferase [Synechococcales cyanobacterium CRU_2_2]|nr:glycosyl transferase [Synechococcales cyanobacterium CRU_2_2]
MDLDAGLGANLRPDLGADLYVAITNHGFGHATRTASVLAVLQRLRPDLQLVLVTGAPRWLLESYLPGPFEYRPRKLDVGVVQADSLQMDFVATRVELEGIRDRQAQMIAEEASWIRDRGIRLVLGDIPPLAAPIAQAAGVPCWMMSNFGWNFIYRDWGAEFEEICRWIEDCFGQCDRLFRLPFHEPMTTFGQIEDVGLTGGTPAYDLPSLRQQIGLTAPPERTVLLTFGGLGLEQIPYDRLAQFPDWQFITFDAHAPALDNLINLNRLGSHRREQDSPRLDLGKRDRPFAPLYRPVDVMPLCRCVISKPGYSTFAEACGQDTPVISLTRQGFAEAALLLDALPDWVPHRILEQADFFEGDWSFLREPLVPVRAGLPDPDQHPPRHRPEAKRGNEAIAGAIAKYLSP